MAKLLVEETNINKLFPLDCMPAYLRLRNQMESDRAYAWTWYSNIVAGCRDEGADDGMAQLMAAHLMHKLFDIRIGYETTGPDDPPLKAYQRSLDAQERRNTAPDDMPSKPID